MQRSERFLSVLFHSNQRCVTNGAVWKSSSKRRLFQHRLDRCGPSASGPRAVRFDWTQPRETLKCQSWQYKSSDCLYPDIGTGRFAGIKESSSLQLLVPDLTSKNRRQKGGWRWKALPWFFSFFWRKRCNFVHFAFNKLDRREIFCYFSARTFSEKCISGSAAEPWKQQQ